MNFWIPMKVFAGLERFEASSRARSRFAAKRARGIVWRRELPMMRTFGSRMVLRYTCSQMFENRSSVVVARGYRGSGWKMNMARMRARMVRATQKGGVGTGKDRILLEFEVDDRII